jgi:hypothetical protein
MPEHELLDPKPPPQVVQPETINVKVTMPPVTISMRAHLWLHWAKIAIRQERRAWDTRAAGHSEANFGPYIGRETEEAIEAVAAARHCIHNLLRVWEADFGLPKQSQITFGDFTTATPADPDKWEACVLGLVGHRNEAVHHNEETALTQPHPGYQTNVSGVAAKFTAERATEAVDIMLEDVIRLAMTAPSPALQKFASDYAHVLELLDRQRISGDDLW